MRTPNGSVPAYSRHVPTGQAYIRVADGSTRRTIYLGVYGSAESYARYAGEVTKLSGVAPPAAGPPPRRTARDVFDAFMVHAANYYRLKDGRPSREVGAFRDSFRQFLAMHGEQPADELSREQLRSARQAMIDAGLSRRVINQRVGRVVRAFRWAAEAGILADPVVTSMRLLRGLPAGRSAAPERPPIKPVAHADVDATLPLLSPTVAALVRLLLATGMRHGEGLMLRPCDIDRRAAVWVADFTGRDKMAYRGRPRRVAIGPRAQAVIAPFLAAAASPTCNLFDTDEHAVRWAIQAACRKAGVPRWCPLQLRHTHATEVRRRFGLEAAQAVLGHASADVTQVYAEADDSLASRVAGEMG